MTHKDSTEVAKYDEALANRKLPPMSQMTRLQKRYFLEPWMTALTLATATVAVVGYSLGILTSRHVEWSMFGLLFTFVSVGFLVTKLAFMEWNSKTEGQVSEKPYNGY